jgi:hypothetical protein
MDPVSTVFLKKWFKRLARDKPSSFSGPFISNEQILDQGGSAVRKKLIQNNIKKYSAEH